MWKKIFAYLLFSVLATGLLVLFTGVDVDIDVLNTLYTVAGIIFSVGMSIAISAKTDQVTKDNKRNAIRRSYKNVRDSFMFLFGISTVLFIVAQVFSITKYPSALSLLCAIFLLVSIVYYVFNFVKLHKLGEDIEDQILRETKREDVDKEAQ